MQVSRYVRELHGKGSESIKATQHQREGARTTGPMPHPSPCFSLPWQTWWEEKMETVAWNFQCLLLMDMCFLGVKELNEVKGSLKEGSGHKYTLWCLEAPWLCPRPSPWNPKKIKDSHITTLLATLEAPPFPRQLQRKTTPKPCSDS